MVERCEVGFGDDDETVCQGAYVGALKGKASARIDNYIIVAISFFQRSEQFFDCLPECFLIQVWDSESLRERGVVPVKAPPTYEGLVSDPVVLGPRAVDAPGLA